MRRLALLSLLVACAHAQRANEPQSWLELQSEHFVVRTDLPPEEAKKSVADMELARTALLGAGWHSNREPKTRTIVVQLASRAELLEFARKGFDGFAADDIF